MLNRNVMLPLAALIAAALVDGAVAGLVGFAPRAWIGWPVVGGLATLVIVALAAQVQAASAERDPDADAYFVAVDGQTTLVATALVVFGIAMLLGAAAPTGAASAGNGTTFAVWAGFVMTTMGFVLAIAKSAVGARRSFPDPAAPPVE